MTHRRSDKSSPTAGLMARSPIPTVPPGRVTATYAYSPGRRVLRYEPATCRPQYLDSVTGLWRFGRGPDAWPLYRQDALPPDRTVPIHVAPCEQDTDELTRLGWTSASPGSTAGPWQAAWTEALAGRPIVIHAPLDAPGEAQATRLARMLTPAATSVGIVLYPDVPPGGTVADALAAIGRDTARALVSMSGQPSITGLVAPASTRVAPDSISSGSGDSASPPRAVGRRASYPGSPPDPLPPLLPPFPMHVLPTSVRTYVAESADVLGVARASIAVPLLALAGSVAGDRYVLRTSRARRLVPMLWVMLVAEPDRAASAIGAARLGFEAIPAWAMPRWTDTMAEDEDRLGRRLPTPVDSRSPAPLPLSRDRFHTTEPDAGPLSSLLARTGSFALISGDNAGQQVLSVEPGSRWDSDREALLTAWSGRHLTIEIPSELPKTIPRPVISVIDMVAPDQFPTLIADDQRSGMISRFLLVMDALPSVDPTGRSTRVDDETLAALIQVFERIDDPSPTRSRPDRDPSGGPVTDSTGPKVILPGAAAASAWTPWLAASAAWRRRATGLEQEIALHWPVQAGRLALILHILWSAEGDGPVHDVLPLARLRDALALADWLRDHALQIHATLAQSSRHTPFGDAPASDTVELTSLGELITRLANVLRDSPETWMTRTDLARRIGSPRFAEVRSALERMEADGIVQRRDFPTRTRISERWQLVTAEPPTRT